jgi:hypothetical protein
MDRGTFNRLTDSIEASPPLDLSTLVANMRQAADVQLESFDDPGDMWACYAVVLTDALPAFIVLDDIPMPAVPVTVKSITASIPGRPRMVAICLEGEVIVGVDSQAVEVHTCRVHRTEGSPPGMGEWKRLDRQFQGGFVDEVQAIMRERA